MEDWLVIYVVCANEKRHVVGEVVDERTGTWNDVDGVENFYGQVWDVVIGEVGSVELWSADWKWWPSVAVVVVWSDQEELDVCLVAGSVVVDWL